MREDKVKTHGLGKMSATIVGKYLQNIYHLKGDVLMYVATAGPIPRAETAPLIQMWKTQILALASNIFSKLLTATVEGRALMNPHIMRPVMMMGSCGYTAMTAQLAAKPAEPKI